jgi:hypothetical protein
MWAAVLKVHFQESLRQFHVHAFCRLVHVEEGMVVKGEEHFLVSIAYPYYNLVRVIVHFPDRAERAVVSVHHLEADDLVKVKLLVFERGKETEGEKKTFAGKRFGLLFGIHVFKPDVGKILTDAYFGNEKWNQLFIDLNKNRFHFFIVGRIVCIDKKADFTADAMSTADVSQEIAFVPAHRALSFCLLLVFCCTGSTFFRC